MPPRAPCVAALLCATLIPLQTQADVPMDGSWQIDTTNGVFPYFIIDKGSLTNASGFLFNPVCVDGKVQAPALITDLQAFFKGHPGTRVIDRGNGHYLLTSSITMDPHHNFSYITGGTMTAIYAELDWDTPGQGTFTIRVASAFFTGEGMGTSTCLAHEVYPLKRVGS